MDEKPSMGLAVEIDRESGIPVYVQLGEQIRLLIRRGALRPGDPMPTVRALAVDLGCNANTVARVYRDLQQDGLLRLERGLGSFVSEALPKRTLTEQDFKVIRQKTTELVAVSRRAGLSSSELSQFVETVWKEHAHDKG